MARVTRLFVYPIKSCRGIEVDSFALTPRGPAFDRRYMLVDAGGRFLTQRRYPQMALIETAFAGEDIIVSAPGCSPLVLPRQGGSQALEDCKVRIWSDTVDATLANPEVNVWFSDYMGFACGLVYLADDQHRAVPNEAAGFDDEVGFADGAPVMLISEASLDELNRRLGEPVTMERFRPNLVVSADTPHAEDDWASIDIGAASLTVAWPCSRCVVPTIDPVTAERHPDNEPTRTLLDYRRRDRNVYFGQNLIPRALGTVAVGDAYVVAKRTGT